MNAFAAIDAAHYGHDGVSFAERCDLGPMFSHAGNIIRFVDGIDVGTEISASGDAIARGNRVLLSQVIENLVKNATEAIRESGRTDGFINISAECDGAAGFCRVVIRDNGPGFDTMVAGQLFERGFSTRQSKSGGLGLHWCANTVRAMEGKLSLEGDGPGLGARATPVLPRWEDSAGRDQIGRPA